MFQGRLLGKFLFSCLFFLFFCSFCYDGFYEHEEADLSNCALVSDPVSLLNATKDALRYLNLYSASEGDKCSIREGRIKKHGISLEDAKHTLAFLVDVLEQDSGKPEQRVCDPNFWRKNFKTLRWKGDKQQAKQHSVKLPDDKVYISKYMIFRTKGSDNKTEEFPYALFSLPFDEDGLSNQQVKAQRDKLTRFKYTKHDVLTGVMDGGTLAKPLVWLKRNDLEEALMQGTIEVELPSGEVRKFVVHKNNGIEYDKRNVARENQKRYWYFMDGTEKVWRYMDVVPMASFAGDIFELGLGKLIAIRYDQPRKKQREVRFGVLSDAGGAFDGNRYQLDYFLGTFSSRADFNKFVRDHAPKFVDAYIVLKK